ARQFTARAAGGAPRGEAAREEHPRDAKEADEPPHKSARDEKEKDEEDRRDRAGKKKFCTRCGAAMPRREKYCPECDALQPDERDPALTEANSKKVAAGLCGVLIGGLGVHKFILGYTTAGVIMLLVTLLTCGVAYPITHIIGMVEGIIYLTKSDEEFRRIYMEGKKEWF
ncbi:MAG TPA: TM2 domain-containing protein, partial [Gemmataceae bacterium]|nr:TM2 domain-containing protein [Gemmataceae bacterium]